MCVDVSAVSERAVRESAGLCNSCGAGVLCADDPGVVCAAAQAAGGGKAVQGIRVPSAARAVYRHGSVDLWCTVAIQTSVHLAGVDSGADWGACVPRVETGGE